MGAPRCAPRGHTGHNATRARRVVERFVGHYNNVRLHSAIGYVAPRSRLEGKDAVIQAACDVRLDVARKARRRSRQAARAPSAALACE